MSDSLREVDYIDKVCAVIADVMDLAADQVSPDQDLFVDLGVESLSLVSIYVFLKRYMGTPEPVDKEHYQALNTPRLIAQYVAAHATSVS